MYNLTQTARFLEILDPEAEYFTFQVYDDSKDKRPELARTIEGSLDELAPVLMEYNEKGAGVFVTLNEVKKGNRRLAKNITQIRTFFSDKDDGPLDVDLPLVPTMVVSGARGPHNYFVLDQPIEVTENSTKQWAATQSSIASVLKSDDLKDLPRVMRLPGFYHKKDPGNPILIKIESMSGEYHSWEEIISTFGGNVEAKKDVTYGAELSDGQKGQLLPNVSKWLELPWSKTRGNNNILILAAANIKRNGYGMDECIRMIGDKGEALNANTVSQISAIYKSDYYKVDPFIPGQKKNSADWIELLRTCKFYTDLAGDEDCYAVSPVHEVIEKVRLASISKPLGKKFVNDNTIYCKYGYDPRHNYYEMENDFGLKIYNRYTPPFWKKGHFFYGTDVEFEENMPEEYVKFFEHLFNSDQDSIDYVLDWMAHAIQGNKNIPILALVGSSRGIGKNVFVYINRALHGMENFEVCKQQIISKEFNGQMLNKTLVHFDEVSISDEKDFESIKAYTNPVIAVENKGVDARTENLFANIILTNNMVDSLCGVSENDDRQFSIPSLTSTPLIQVEPYKNTAKINELYKDEELIGRLARYLYGREINQSSIFHNLKTDHYYGVIKSSVMEWQKFILEDLHYKYGGQAITFTKVREAIKTYERINVGRVKIEKLCDTNPDMMAWIRHKGERCLVLAGVKEGADEFEARMNRLRSGDWEDTKKLKEDISVGE